MNWMELTPAIVAVVGVLGSNTAWRFYEKRASAKAREDSEVRKNAHEDHVVVRDDLRERVATLESKLEVEYREKVDLLKTLADLKEQVAALKTKLEMLTLAPRIVRQSKPKAKTAKKKG